MRATGSRFLVLSSYLDVFFQDKTKTTMPRSHNLQKKIQIERGHVDRTFVREIKYGVQRNGSHVGKFQSCSSFLAKLNLLRDKISRTQKLNK